MRHGGFPFIPSSSWGRRPSGAGGWSPSDVTGLIAWYDANVGVLTDVDGVYRWEDQSGNGRHLDQSTGSYKPDATTTAYGAALYFDGADDHLTCDTTAWGTGSDTVNNGVTMYMVAQLTAAATSNRLFQSLVNTTSSPVVMESGDDFRCTTSTRIVLTAGDDWAAGTHLLGFRWHNTTGHIRKNLSELASGNNGRDGYLFDGLRLADWGAAAPSAPSEVYFHEILIYDSAEGYAAQADAESYLNTRWGLGL